MSVCRRLRAHTLVLAGYVSVGLVFSWPLPRYLSTHLTGSPYGDTGVYVWNLWVFRHELIDHHRLPVFTSSIFSLDVAANLSLHNYTPFTDILALPFLSLGGPITTFNVIYLTIAIATAYAGFLLARRVTGTTAEAWLAGLVFGWSPVLVARSAAHFSLVLAAPLPLFLLLLHRVGETWRLRDAVATGAIAAWAALCDVYYGVYCLAMAGTVIAFSGVRLRPRQPYDILRSGRVSLRPVSWWSGSLHVATLAAGTVVVWIAVTGGGEWTLLGSRVSVRSLYTPVLVLTVLVMLQLSSRSPWTLAILKPQDPWRAVKLMAAGGTAFVLPLAPILYALAVRIADGRYPAHPIFWRSSPPGLDAAAFVLPNPNHPWFGTWAHDWLARQPSGLIENVASIPLIVILVVGVAAIVAWRQLPGIWIALTAVFACLALGPFVRVAGIDTYVPTPWAVLRYVPIIGDARMPTRFSVVVMLGSAVLFAFALRALVNLRPRLRPAILMTIGGVALIELAPVPRPLYAADVPDFYRWIAADSRNVRVLNLPFGIRDGTSSVGNFSAASQFYQAFHGKHLIGGYLSRVSSRRVRDHQRVPVIEALFTLSEGRHLTPELHRRATARGSRFVASTCLGYVVVHLEKASPDLIVFAENAFDLRVLAEAGHQRLYGTYLAFPPAHQGDIDCGPQPRRPAQLLLTQLASDPD